MLIVDSQVHIWINTTMGAIHRQIPNFTAEDLIAEMDEAGVDRVILHPPGVVPNGNEIAVAAANAHPDRFRVLGWVHMDQPELSAAKLAGWLDTPGMLGLRFLFIAPGRESWPTDGTMDWIWPIANEQKMPVGLLAHEFLPTVGELAEKYPDIPFLIDHLGANPFKPGIESFDTLPELVALARHPNVAVKMSGANGNSTEPYPHTEIHDKLQQIFDAFGPDRCFWGTDLSRMKCSYKECVTLFTEELPWLKGRDLELVMGEALCNWVGWDLPA
ncbi:MAG: amidohydrolase family protein [Alphaproteobacteria bacterium]